MKKRVLNNFLAGFGSVLNFVYFANYIYPKKSDLMKDKMQLGKDTAAVGKDLYSVIKKEYGKISLGQD